MRCGQEGGGSRSLSPDRLSPAWSERDRARGWPSPASVFFSEAPGPMDCIYLDNNATTPPLPAVWDAMRPYLTTVYGNPASAHQVGRRAPRALEDAREQVAALLDAHADEVIFTSGATEANNLALFGLCRSPPGSSLGQPHRTSLRRRTAPPTRRRRFPGRLAARRSRGPCPRRSAGRTSTRRHAARQCHAGQPRNRHDSTARRLRLSGTYC